MRESSTLCWQVARTGQFSLFAALRECIPAACRCQGVRAGLTEVALAPPSLLHPLSVPLLVPENRSPDHVLQEDTRPPY